MDAELKIKIGADTVEVTKSIDRLKQQLKTFEDALGKATDAKRIDLLNRSIEKTKNIIAGVKGFKLDNNLPQVAKGANQATTALTNFSRVAQDAPFGMIGIANNIEPLIGSFQSLYKETGSAKAAFAALGSSLIGGGGLILIAGLASTAMSVFGKRLFGAKKEADDAKESFRSVAEAQAEGIAGTRERILSLQTLASVVKDTSKSEGERLSALREIKKIDPDITQGITLQASSLQTLTQRVQEYTNAIIAKNIADEFGKEIGKLSVEEAKQELVVEKARLAVQQARAKLEAAKRAPKASAGSVQSGGSDALTGDIKNAQKAVDNALAGFSEQEKKFFDLTSQRLVFENAFVKAKEKEVDLMKNFNKETEKVDSKKPFDLGRFFLGERVKFAEDVQKLSEDTFKPFFFSVGEDSAKALVNGFNAIGLDVRGGELQQLEINKRLQELKDNAIKTAGTITDTLSPAINSFFQSIASGSGSPFKALGEALKQLLVQLAAAIAKALIFKAILTAINPGAAAGQSFMSLFSNFAGLGSAAPGSIRTGGILGVAAPSSERLVARVRGQALDLVLQRTRASKGI